MNIKHIPNTPKTQNNTHLGKISALFIVILTTALIVNHYPVVQRYLDRPKTHDDALLNALQTAEQQYQIMDKPIPPVIRSEIEQIQTFISNPPVERKVCTTTRDNSGNVTSHCRTILVRQRYPGTPVPSN